MGWRNSITCNNRSHRTLQRWINFLFIFLFGWCALCFMFLGPFSWFDITQIFRRRERHVVPLGFYTNTSEVILTRNTHTDLVEEAEDNVTLALSSKDFSSETDLLKERSSLTSLQSVVGKPTVTQTISKWLRNKNRRKRISERFENASIPWKDPQPAKKPWKTPYVAFQNFTPSSEPICNEAFPKLARINGKKVSRLHHLQNSGTRVLVVAPRFGLGNTLRGYVSSFVYSVLSGRKIVRLHGGFHFQTFDALCQSFVCGFDSIPWQPYKHPHKLWFALGKLEPKPNLLKVSMHKSGLLQSVASKNPVIVSHFANHFDGYWLEDRNLSRCVHSAFNCKGVKNLWCIYSKALHALLGEGPSAELDETIKSVVKKSSSVIPKTIHQNPKVQQNDSVSGGTPVADVSFMFDIAIHLRTRTKRIESLASLYKCKNEKCKKRLESSLNAEEGKYASPNLWKCIGKVLQGIERYLPRKKRQMNKGGYTIFLATDSEHFRRKFVKQLKPYGTVYYSSGKVLHTSKAQDFRNRMPTMAEFFLMSKSHVILEAEEYVSTFANFAALYGNGTLLALRYRNGGEDCRTRVVHKGMSNPHRPSNSI